MGIELENERVIFRLIYILKRLTDKWATEQLAFIAHEGFNMTFMPYFMSIGKQGVTNLDLVSKIKVTKQAVSKTIKELEKLNLVYQVKSDTDARSIMIYLTEEGIGLYDGIALNAENLTAEYRKLTGARNYENAVDTVLKIIDYHEDLKKNS